MTSAQLCAVSPLLVLGAFVVLGLLVLAVRRSHAFTASLTALGLLASIASLAFAWDYWPCQVTALFFIDPFGLFLMGLVFSAALAVTMLAFGYFARQPGRHEEFYILLLTATLGAAVLVTTNHLAGFFIGLELLSVSLYAMIAYSRASFPGLEGALKYLVLAGVSSAFLIFGMALVYAQTGALSFSAIVSHYASASPGPVDWVALVMILVGVGFKLALVPFHQWTPDVYQGAPAPVTAFIATVSKGAVFALLLRFYAESHVQSSHPMIMVFSLVAVASMLFGNLLALMQDNLKRMLAYSSIAHLGYLLVIFLPGGWAVALPVVFYLTAYFITTLGAFGVVSVLSDPRREAQSLSDYAGLAWRRPWLCGVLVAMLLSLAGMPLTVGFIAKFFVFSVGIRSDLWMLVLVMILSSVIGLYYYLRVIVVMFSRSALATPRTLPATPLVAGVALATLTVLLVGLGIYPSPLLRLLEKFVLILS